MTRAAATLRPRGRGWFNWVLMLYVLGKGMR